MLTLVTHTKKVWNRDISRCVTSVNTAIKDLSGVNHEIIEDRREVVNFESFTRLRYNSIKLDNYIAFIDDDDYLDPGIITSMIPYVRHEDFGIIYCTEVKFNDTHFSTNASLIAHNTYENLHENPPTNLCFINTKYVTEQSLKLSLAHNARIEHVMKLEAASKGGAFYIQLNGYYSSTFGHNRLDKYPSFSVNPDMKDFFTNKYNGPIKMVRP